LVDIATVEKIANLARLEIDDDQKPYMAEQLGKILGYVEELSKVDTTGVEATAFMAPAHDSLRDDVVIESLAVDTVLSNAPIATKGHFAVPKVIG
jgi:aspartyl-tRNA(Asn)/glutamyl-tRNA(Gln) amidotransferase subunit C